MIWCMRTPTPEERVAIGRTLREAREEMGLLQEEIAERLGVDQAHISRIEGGKYQRPNPIVLMEFSSQVGCNPLTLIAPFFSDAGQAEPEQVPA
jgi:transcriptional regulator with XRE-family HTH domain